MIFIKLCFHRFLMLVLVCAVSQGRFIKPRNSQASEDPSTNKVFLEALSDTYGTDISKDSESNHNNADSEEQIFLQAVSDTYGSDITPNNQNTGSVINSEDAVMLEAIRDVYGTDISPPAAGSGETGQPSNLQPLDAMMLEAISDVFGSDITPPAGAINQGRSARMDNSQAGWPQGPGVLQPEADDRYVRPIEQPGGNEQSAPNLHMDDMSGHTGHGNDDHVMSLAAPRSNIGATRLGDNNERIYKDQSTFIPSIQQLKHWTDNFHKKQKEFFKKYVTKGGREQVPDGAKLDSAYFSSDSIFTTNRFTPNREHFYVDHNITRSDIGRINYNLLKKDNTLDYNVLRATPNGRHLLMVTLLEDIFNPLWLPRLKGRIAFYLPDSLKPPGQPKTGRGAMHLPNIISHGRIAQRDEMLSRFRGRMPSVFSLDEDMSRFNLTHAEAVASLMEIIMGYETFDSTLAFLVFIHPYIRPRTFADTVMTVVDVREDVGFIMPQMQTINPYDYFQIFSFKNLTNWEERHKHEHQHRGMRRPPMWSNDYLEDTGQGGGQVWRISWNEGEFRTLDENDIEQKLWYFREDPMVSAHHLHWHLKMSNRQAPAWHPSNGMNMDRRGEMFYFMHKQMLARYNCDRIALDMPLTTPLQPEEWDQPFVPGYPPSLQRKMDVHTLPDPMERSSQI